MTPEDESAPPAKPRTGGALRGSWRLAAAALLLVCGIVFVLLGWYGAAHTNILTEQIPYLISGGLLGLGLIVVAGFLASSASLERETRELRREIVRALEVGTLRTGPAPVSAGPVSANGQVFVLPGGHSYHVAGCPILEDKEGVRSLVAAEATASGLAPCKLCGPD